MNRKSTAITRLSLAHWRHSVSALELTGRIAAYTIISLGALLMLFPFVWMLSTSLKSYSEVFAWPPVWIPSSLQWRNYPEALTILPFARYFRNTATVVAFNVVGATLSSSLAGYAFARLRARGKNVVFILLLSTMMLPNQVTLIPHYVIYKVLGWIDTLKPLIVPAFLGGGAFNIFLMRQFFLTLPAQLEEAAYIDGCTAFGIWYRIMLPLAKPALGTVAIFTFMGNWNDFFHPLIYLHSPENRTMALALQFFRDQYGTDMHLLMAASVTMLIPMLIVFFSAQKVFVKGIALTGLKG